MARAAALSPLPVDVRLTMAGANAVIAVMAIVLAAAALLWLTQLDHATAPSAIKA